MARNRSSAFPSVLPSRLGFQRSGRTLKTDMIPCPHLPAKARVSLVIANDALGNRVPFEMLVGQMHRHAMDQAGRAGAVAQFGGGDMGLARADRVQPVPVLLGAAVEMNLVGADYTVKDL